MNSFNKYHSFGMPMPGRQFSSNSYRFGFQGQEKDDEIKGSGNSINFKYRMHDPRIGRFFAIDPLAANFPWNSPYAFSENRVIDAYELEGLENIKLNYSSRTMQDLMRIYATNEGATKIDAINDKTLRRNFLYGDYNIKRVSLAKNSSYEPSTNTVRYGTGMSWYPSLVEGASFPSYVILGHEINHAYDELYQQNGVILNKDNYTNKQKVPIEKSSVQFGNYLRSAYGSNWLRDEYSGLFDNMNTNSNKTNEKITNFTLLGGWETFTNDLHHTMYKNMEVGKYYSTSYEKSVNGGESKKYWMTSWVDKDGYSNFKTFDNEKDFNNFITPTDEK